jgi:hypothetical protein
MQNISLKSADSLLSVQAAKLLAESAEVVSGNFTRSSSSSSQLLLRISKGFILCTADEKGRTIRLDHVDCNAADSIRDDVAPACADFDGDGSDELLYASSDAGKLYLLKPMMHREFLSMQTRKIVSGLTDCHNILALRNAGQNVIAACIAYNGNYTLLKSWSKGAITAEAPIQGPSCWNRKFFSTAFVALPPFGNSRSAMLLCSYIRSGTNDRGMILYSTDENNSVVQVLKTAPSGPLPKYNQSIVKTSDRIFSIQGRGDRSLQFLRDRDDFRYDIQLIRLENDGRWICTPMDFARQGDEDNPKYNPICRVIPLDDSPQGLLCLVITRAGENERPAISLYIAGNAESGGISNPNP